jgi:hypothetical protein
MNKNKTVRSKKIIIMTSVAKKKLATKPLSN